MPGNVHQGIGCIVVRSDTARPVLILRRAFGRFEGSWCFVAGTIEAGEDPRHAARRELAEETGLEPESITELGLLAEPGLDLHVFLARVSGPTPIRLDSEHSEARWVSYEEAAGLLPLEAQRQALTTARAMAVD